MFNVNDVVTFGARTGRFQSKRGWGSYSTIPRYMGIINTVTPKAITVYAPTYSKRGEITFTLRSNGRWVQLGEQDDKFDRISVQDYDIGSVDLEYPAEYFNLLHLGVDRQVLDDAIFQYISTEIDKKFDDIHHARQRQLEETTERARDMWDMTIKYHNDDLAKLNARALAHLKLKAMPLTDSPFEEDLTSA